MSSLTITHTTAEGTLVDGTARGDGSAPVLKRHRFRWSHNLGSWYVPKSRDRIADRYKIDRCADELRAAGFEVALEIDNATVDPAEREARRDERAAARIDGLTAKAERKAGEADSAYAASRRATEGIPFGQPILVGHHSERGHRAALKRSDQAMGRMSQAMDEQRDAENRARGTAAAQRRRQRPDYIGNRITELEADERRLGRILAGTQHVLSGPAEGDYRADCEARLAQTQADLTHWRGQLAALEAEGVRLWGPADFKPGDLAKVHGRWAEVVRANPKTLSVSSGYSWSIRYRYTEVQDRREPAAA